jgi:hypothetical protein
VSPPAAVPPRTPEPPGTPEPARIPEPPGIPGPPGIPERACSAASRPVSSITWVDANGTTWRLRSLVAMGHGAGRLAAALRLRPDTVRKLLRGEIALLSEEIRDHARQLWEAWWDKRPPETTRGERQAAASARRRAEHHKWCAPAGLDEDQLDDPGYRPYSGYRPAAGTGVAGHFQLDDKLPDASDSQ